MWNSSRSLNVSDLMVSVRLTTSSTSMISLMPLSDKCSCLSPRSFDSYSEWLRYGSCRIGMEMLFLPTKFRENEGTLLLLFSALLL